MLEIVLTLKATLRSVLKTRRELVLENLALRHQLAVLRRAHRRPRFRPSERLLWVALRRFWEGWKEALGLVRPATVVRWHRQGFRRHWCRKSRRRPGRPRVDLEIRALIRRMAKANPLWGAPRIHGSRFRRRVAGLAITEVLSTPRAPWQNPYVERLIGSIRRQCLDHVVVWNERHLQRILRKYLSCYHRSRTHLSLCKDSPHQRDVQPAAEVISC